MTGTGEPGGQSDLDRLAAAMNNRFDGIDRRFDGIDQRFDRVDERLEHHDQTLDRLLTLALDHGSDISDLKKDFRLMRGAVDGIQSAVTEHLSWHLGRGA